MTAQDRRQAWIRLGELLTARRVEIDPRYTNKRLFAGERGVNYRVISDIEAARRDNFGAPMLRAIEVAYRLERGAIAEAIEQGPAEALRVEQPEMRVAEISAADGMLLVPVPADMTEAERQRVQEWAARMAADIVRLRQTTDRDGEL
ncbi:hypothetical protein ITP53_11510 [Nonomuraea sp. K274]|uniref:Uncharacterized protein n=1 Tax=Nonomuraea cypriaca TaxID=1187855 RepID=A0A931EZN7_9ACTN|nr:hypothetical protein [Nonomuraea cypriaca]MBF8186366.1 hypothetical protein [Nonomuraea cypriaca]